MISPGLITPSSIARASSASLLGAVRPVAAYLARARLMYCRTVFSLIPMRRPTDAFDMPWNHSSSACRSCSDSAGRAGCWSASIALACDRVMYGRSAAAASTASTRWSRPSSLDTKACAPLSSVSITIAGSLCPEKATTRYPAATSSGIRVVTSSPDSSRSRMTTSGGGTAPSPVRSRAVCTSRTRWPGSDRIQDATPSVTTGWSSMIATVTGCSIAPPPRACRRLAAVR